MQKQSYTKTSFWYNFVFALKRSYAKTKLCKNEVMRTKTEFWYNKVFANKADYVRAKTSFWHARNLLCYARNLLC